ncbi:hypothetical protein RK21_00559 [Pseudomonas plecoglossicida]|nr:hypothetical protein RK21_00559 [Pseudomonas plecoglossicida]
MRRGGSSRLTWTVGDKAAGLFAGKPAPTGTPQASRLAQYLWERVYPRRGRYRQHHLDK